MIPAPDAAARMLPRINNIGSTAIKPNVDKLLPKFLQKLQMRAITQVYAQTRLGRPSGNNDRCYGLWRAKSM
jgi:hypothetical protein